MPPAILVVDDDPAIRDLVSLALRRAGFRTSVAASGEEALELLGRETIDGVVLDMGMAGMSGIDVIRRVRSGSETATLPMLLMTGSGDDGTVLRALEAGANDYLNKPVRLDELVARVRAHLRTKTAWTDQVNAELRMRAVLVDVLAATRSSTVPDAVAVALVTELGQKAGYPFVAVIEIRDERRLEVLATYNAVAGVERGGTLDPDRAQYILSRLHDGPWVGVFATPGPSEPTGAFWAAGVGLAAGAAIYSGDRTVGVLIIGQRPNDAMSAPATQAKLLAAVIDYASIMSMAAGPAIAHHGQVAASRSRLQQAISRRAFTPVFQPIVSLADRTIFGYEVLTRFDDGTRPDVRFAEAAEHGLRSRLEEMTLEVALAQTDRLPPETLLFLNASPGIVLASRRLMKLLAKTTHDVVLELTEHARIDDYPALSRALAKLGPRVRVAVDDAGAGYASLRHILELRPAFVKLDISIVGGIEADPVRQALVSGLVFFANRTGSELIAEGVETEREAEVLSGLGIRYAQGFLLGRPAPMPEAPAV